ncbi:hypothetical protein [Ideonella dechloratans]|uniref:hypothetical protein n=1 Tax=Ideonella dechloratans TaxID=36863 RepID=UPI0035AEB637
MPPPHTPPPSAPALSYLRLRWRWSAQALREWLWRRRRQAGVLAALLAGCAGDLPSAWASLQSVLVLSVWPLARWSSAGQLTPWLGGLLLQTTLGALQALALFPWLWRPAWRTQDNALPLSPATRWRADALLVGLTQLPWVLAQMAGSLSLLAQQPAWLTGPARGLWLTGLVLAQGLAVLAGTAGLARWRQAPRGRWPQGVARRSAVSAHRPALRWQRALLWLPLWAGPARPLARAGLQQAAGLALCAATVGLGRLSQAHLQPLLLQAARELPLQARRLERGRRLQLLWPTAAGAAVLLGVLLAGPLPLASWRPGVLAAWALWMLPALWRQTAPASPDPVARTSAGLLGLLLGLALASDALKESPR